LSNGRGIEDDPSIQALEELLPRIQEVAAPTSSAAQHPGNRLPTVTTAATEPKNQTIASHAAPSMTLSSFSDLKKSSNGNCCFQIVDLGPFALSPSQPCCFRNIIKRVKILRLFLSSNDKMKDVFENKNFWLETGKEALDFEWSGKIGRHSSRLQPLPSSTLIIAFSVISGQLFNKYR